MSNNTSKSHLRVKCLCEGALMVAMAQVLGYLKLFSLPSGGSITLNMFPIFFYCVRWGLARGTMAAFAFSLLQLFLDGAYAWGWESILGDYIFAYSVLGLAGLFWKQKGAFFLGATVGSAVRFLVHYVVGATVWASYMPDTFFGMTMTSPWFYSLLYNGSYILLCWVLVTAVGLLLQKPMKRWFQPQM